MGSASREALTSSRSVLGSLANATSRATGVELLAAGRVIGHSKHLTAALSDPGAENGAKRSLIERLFVHTLDESATKILTNVVENRWSRLDDLLAGIEELGLRIIAASASDPSAVESELFEVGRIVASDAELELALGSRRGGTDAKLALIQTLLGGKFSEQTIEIVKHLVQQPRGRRIGELFRSAAVIVAEQAGFGVAIVTSAQAIAPQQRERLEKSLSHMYGRTIRINGVIDPAIVGGLRVQLGDDVIDGTISTQLNDLRLRLAG